MVVDSYKDFYSSIENAVSGGIKNHYIKNFQLQQ
jgi:hypothetical protein